MCAESVLVSRQRSFQAGAGRRYAGPLLGKITGCVLSEYAVWSVCSVMSNTAVRQCGDSVVTSKIHHTSKIVCIGTIWEQKNQGLAIGFFT